jgi:fatty-acyl-CoA synthase
MLGLMQTRPLMIADLLRHAARHHGEAEIVSKSAEGALFRYTWRDMERRARRLARALAALGIGPGDRVGTLAWNNHRHLEAYFGVPGMGSICHTINPRLHPDDIAYIINHASDRVLLVDSSFAQLLGAVAPHITDSVRAVVFLTSRADMPQVDLPHGMRLLCYEELIEAADEDYVWPVFDENTASALCYTSGTTGRPKGVLYSHRSTVLHAYGFNTPDGLALRAVDRLLPVVPMFHVNAWGAPYMCAMSGAALVMPGRFLDGPSLASLMNAERVTVTAGVPTVWMGLLQHLRASGERLHTVKRIMTGGSACPPLLISAFGREYGVKMEHGWGMTEVSPVGTYNQPKPAQAGLSLEEQEAFTLKQGRALPGLDMKIVDAEGRELPWDGVRFGDLKVRGNWVAESYFGHRPGSAVDADGWFATGDVAVIDPDGFMRA